VEGFRSQMDPKRVVADGYDRMGQAFSAWNSERSPEARRWFLGEVLSRLGYGSDVLELGCGPGTDAEELSAGRRYLGNDGRDLSNGSAHALGRRFARRVHVLANQLGCLAGRSERCLRVDQEANRRGQSCFRILRIGLCLHNLGSGTLDAHQGFVDVAHGPHRTGLVQSGPSTHPENALRPA
jgi:SAM-dependent methyltransferase